MGNQANLRLDNRNELKQYLESKERVSESEEYLDIIEDDRYLVEELDTGLEVVDLKSRNKVFFPSLEVAVDTILESEIADRRERYGTYNTEEDGTETTVIYDKDNPNAWIQMDSDIAVSLEEL